MPGIDTSYPFEFSMPVEEAEAGLVLRVSGIRPDGQAVESSEFELKL